MLIPRWSSDPEECSSAGIRMVSGCGKLYAWWVCSHSMRILNGIPMQEWAERMAHGAHP